MQNIKLSVSLHPQLRTKPLRNTLGGGFRKENSERVKQRDEKIAKKVAEKFGGSKKMLYLCTTFRDEKRKQVFETVL